MYWGSYQLFHDPKQKKPFNEWQHNVWQRCCCCVSIDHIAVRGMHANVLNSPRFKLSNSLFLFCKNDRNRNWKFAQNKNLNILEFQSDEAKNPSSPNPSLHMLVPAERSRSVASCAPKLLLSATTLFRVDVVFHRFDSDIHPIGVISFFLKSSWNGSRATKHFCQVIVAKDVFLSLSLSLLSALHSCQKSVFL